MDEAGRDARGPDRATQWLIVVIAETAAIVLLVLHEGIDRQWPGFAYQNLQMPLYTLAIAPPLMLALSVERLAERFLYLAIGLLAVVLAVIAVHTGNDCLPESWGCNAVSTPYWTSLTVGLFVLLPFLQTWRDAGTRLPIGLPYTKLYHHAWDNALALAAAAAFVGAAWAVLWLWGALFALIGIPEFRELFDKPRFVYPVTGLVTGFGLVMSRAQSGALRAVLRLCLSLARALLPLVMLLALLFLAVVTLKGPEALWQTRRAASLLLWLVLFGVVLANGVYQDGGAEARYPRWLRTFVSAGLLSLPAHAALAIWAISLRVDQHGWTPERLTALMVAVILTLHALLLAWAALPTRDGRWLARLSVSNPLLAGVVVLLLLASQSPLLDFRAMTVDSQLGRLARGEIQLSPNTTVANLPQLDFNLFEHELGRRGRIALEKIRIDPRNGADKALLAAIDKALGRPDSAVKTEYTLVADDLIVLPAGTALPDGLISALATDLAVKAIPKTVFGEGCARASRRCLLVPIDLGGPVGDEWLFFASPEAYRLPPLVYGRSAEGQWQLLAWAYEDDSDRFVDLATRATETLPKAAPTDWQPVWIGSQPLPIVSGRPPRLRGN